ncbi:hypothetical protein ACFV5M_01890 [Streptomyces albidoflavus]
MTLNLPAEPTMTPEDLRDAVRDTLGAAWLTDHHVRFLNLGDKLPNTSGPTVTVLAERDVASLLMTALRNDGTLLAARPHAPNRVVVAERTEETQAHARQFFMERGIPITR